MCGIAAAVGQWSADATRSAVERMLDAQLHRGPDDSGAWTDTTSAGAVALGNRRLSIQDVSQRGHQPMVDAATGAVLVYNGEIYNFVELRAELTARGHVFRGGSDTEVLLHAYRQWGSGCLDRLRGMFAFAIWEPARRRLFVARDAIGIKPLYVAAVSGRGLLCASELRALVASGLVQRNIDRSALAGFLAYGATQEPHSILEGIVMLPAGSWIEADEHGTVVARGCFWQIPTPDPAVARTHDELVAEGRDILSRAVTRHMRSDVPVGVFLSSGLDSTGVLGHACRGVPGPVHAFTVAFPDDPHLDESPVARRTAARLGAEYHECVVDVRSAAAWTEDALAAMDQPVMDGVNTYIVSRAVREHGLVVALSGQGGDELFGGYPSFRDVPAWHRVLRRMQPVPRAAQRAVASVATARMNRVAREKVRDMLTTGDHLAGIYFQRRRLLPDVDLAALGLQAAELGLTPSFHHPSGSAPVSDDDAIAAVRRLEIEYYLRNILLRDGDVFGMASSLEIRVPLLDRDLVDWALRIPGESLLPRGKPGKYLLQRMCAEFYAPEQLSMKKRGFAPPFALWLLGPLRERMEEAIRVVKQSALVDPRGVDAVRDAFLREPHSPAWTRVWSLLSLGVWLERHTATAPQRVVT